MFTTRGGSFADKEAVGRLKFKILEMGGKRVRNEVQKSNPTATPGREHGDCVACLDRLFYVVSVLTLRS